MEPSKEPQLHFSSRHLTRKFAVFLDWFSIHKPYSFVPPGAPSFEFGELRTHISSSATDPPTDVHLVFPACTPRQTLGRAKRKSLPQTLLIAWSKKRLNKTYRQKKRNSQTSENKQDCPYFEEEIPLPFFRYLLLLRELSLLLQIKYIVKCRKTTFEMKKLVIRKKDNLLNWKQQQLFSSSSAIERAKKNLLHWVTRMESLLERH